MDEGEVIRLRGWRREGRGVPSIPLPSYSSLTPLERNDLVETGQPNQLLVLTLFISGIVLFL